jgi:hypothetical protein
MERKYLDNLLVIGKVIIFSEEEIPYTQNFTVGLELHCFLAFLRKLFGNAHHSGLLSIFDRDMQQDHKRN